MWRNVYRLPDGSYHYGWWRRSREQALDNRMLGGGVVRCLGVMHAPDVGAP